MNPSKNISDFDVMFKLRKLKQPAILFGESQQARYQRLLAAEVKLIEGTMSLENTGKKFDEFKEEFEGDPGIYWTSDYLDQGKECQRYEDNGLIWKKEKWEHPFVIEASELSYFQKSLIVYMWWKEMLSVWKENLSSEEAPLYQMTCKTFKELIKALKSEIVSEEILRLYFSTIRFCQIKSYIRAHEVYFKLSAINTYADSQRLKNSKRYSDQSFRKCIQTFKRMISLSQKYFPNDPSKTVLI
jgi:pre-mRNA processing factor 4 (PRP4) like